jgi:DNA polymerase-3 subunit delta'
MFKSVIGNKKLVDYLISSVDNQRIPHAQLFVGSEGIGMLNIAINYAAYIINHEHNVEKTNNKVSNRVIEMSHPDVHYVYPVINTEKIKKAVRDDYLISFREFVLNNHFGSLKDWLDRLAQEKKQSQIGSEEIQSVLKKISLKSYEGGYKIMILWMADKMNISSSNKILKLLEEPPQKTVFILITERVEDIIPTILSRCQVIEFKKPKSSEIEDFLIQNNVELSLAKKSVHLAQGNINKAIKLAHQENDEKQFEEWVIKWVRSAYSAKGNAAAVLNLIAWGEEIASYS